MNYYLKKALPLSILLVAFISVQRFSLFPIGSKSIYWACFFVILAILWKARFTFFENENRNATLIVDLFLIWNVVAILRGPFYAESYWDWKNLIGTSMDLLFPVLIFVATNNQILQSILSFYIKITIPFFIFLVPFLPIGQWGWYMFPISFLMLFLPVLKRNWKWVLLALTAITIGGGLATRSFVLKYGIPIFLMVLYYFRLLPWTTGVIKFGRYFLLVLPWVLFVLAVTGVFNVFKIGENSGQEYVTTSVNNKGQIIEQSAVSDTRSFLFIEVLQSAVKYNYWFLGHSAARGNETTFFAVVDEITVGDKNERMRNEVNVLNVFTWTGVIGVILYFLVFIRAGYFAIHRSNNIFSKIIGLYVSFRWVYAWIEDFYSFDLNNYVIWLMIGICFSESFRRMNDAEVKLWVRGIFDRHYATAFQYYTLIKKDYSDEDKFSENFRINY